MDEKKDGVLTSVDKDGVEHWKSPRSEVLIWAPSPNVIRFKYYGFNEASCVGWIETTANKMIRAGRSPVEMFVDCWDQDGYEPGFRTGLTEWNKRIHGDIHAMALLIRSKVAAMGITVSNIALGGIMTPYTDQKKFEIEIAAAVARGKKMVAESSRDATS